LLPFGKCISALELTMLFAHMGKRIHQKLSTSKKGGSLGKKKGEGIRPYDHGVGVE